MLSLCIQWIDKLYTADSFCIYVLYVKFSGTYQHCLDTRSLQHAGLQSSPFFTMQQIKHMVNLGRKHEKRKAIKGGKTDIVLPLIFSTYVYKGQTKKSYLED